MVGRSAERLRINRLVADAKDGWSRSLVLRGEAGIGKTALLDYAAAVAGGMRVLRVVGIESEAELAFAALQLLFARDLDRFTALSGTQAEALRAAFGAGRTPVERHVPAAATLSLLSELACDGPLLCLLDDAQWLDQPSVDALLFAVRRLHAAPVATIFAVRDGERPFPAAGLDSVTLSRLDRPDAARLVAATRPLPREVADRVVAESGGNPLAIVELAAHAAEATGLPAPVAPLPVTGRFEEHFGRQVRALPDRTRRALLVAACDNESALPTVLAAAERLGLGATDFGPAERGRLVHVTPDGVVFRHPLIRAACYQDAAYAERRTAHQALALSLNEPRDADRRVWHLATAAEGPDDEVADELERVAERAVGRGGPAAAARALERAAGLSTSPAARGRRLVAAARAAYDAGQFDRAVDLADAGTHLAQRPGDIAEAGWIRAQVAYERSSPAEAARIALEAAGPVLVVDPRRAVAILTEAVWCARDAADLGLLSRAAEQLRAVRGGPAALVDALIGLTDLLRGDIRSAVEPMRGTLLATRDSAGEVTVERMLAGFLGLLVGEDDTAVTMFDDHVAELRGQGALGRLPYAQEPLALGLLVTGRFRDAEANVDEALSMATELGQGLQAVVLTAISAWLAAVRGDTGAATRSAARVLNDPRQHRMATAQATWALALTDLAGGDTVAALKRLDAVCAGPPGRDLMVRAVPDYVEAAVRLGDTDAARRRLPLLTEWATHTKSAVATALVLRCQAMLAEDAEQERLFEESLHTTGCAAYDLARTRLVYAEWLRRSRRRMAARRQLLLAHETFDQIGAHGWQPRVRAELTALGETAPGATAQTAGGLTPQELQVVRRAALGLSNREIAAELFLSPRTIGHHLYRAYPKLGVRRRAELGRLDL
ncbi:hypothetical protein ALI22I_14710 [Saccharothrix sp. ALI-22-I]|uniref:ATP-binding protein n=1 Tax=Saccharothrix sp. ALI-22-I TaxID=1933778 RepID=UPI00097C3AEE|nr:LuxR family transcriptional regulator [Saccharothrix sp. ALI-22-I]ONI89737.1 hypothetical protein ALI22I_14710 [Saccharothrix sp. ALI-22-I]